MPEILSHTVRSDIEIALPNAGNFQHAETILGAMKERLCVIAEKDGTETLVRPIRLIYAWNDWYLLYITEGYKDNADFCIEKLDSYAFYDCILLKKVMMGKCVAVIKKAAFKDCHLLEQCDLPESVTHIGNMAFTKCRKLKEIRVTDSLVSLGWSAFSATGITEFNFPRSLKIVPEECFLLCEKLRKIVLPDNLQVIEPKAFALCKNLTDIVLPESLKTLGWGAFYECKKITQINIPSGIKVLDYRTFYETGITETVLPSNLKTVYAFESCDELKKATVCEGVKKMSFDYCKNLSEVVLPKSIRDISFKGCSSLKMIDLPLGLKKISQSCFEESGIESIEIPDSVKQIDDSAFYGCTNLREVKINKPVELGNSVFKFCKKLTKITLPKNWYIKGANVYDGKKLIRKGVFDFKTDVKINGYVLNKKMTKVLSAPFGFSAELPQTVYKIGSYALKDCRKKNIIIPPSISCIGKYAFEESEIESIEIPDTVTEIESGVFEDCKKLRYVRLPENLKEIPASMFRGCKNLKHIHLPQNLKTIGWSAFENSGIEEIVFPSDLTKIDFYAFEGTGLISINLQGKKKMQVYAGAFSGCNNLTNVTIAENIILQERVFEKCKKLESVKFPSKQISILAGTFAGCENLDIQVSDNMKVDVGAFSGCKSITVCHGTEQYKAIDGVLYDSEMKKILSVALSVTDVVIPKTQTIIPSHLFFHCSNLKSVKFHEFITRIEDFAFASKKLTTIIIPKQEGEFELEHAAFYHCPNVNVAMPEELRVGYSDITILPPDILYM